MDFSGIGGVAWLGDLIIQYAAQIHASKMMSLQNKKDAKLALVKAFNETECYYALLASGENKDISKEYQIATLWDNVAVFIEPENPELAHRLNVKSRFWREGAAWTDEQIKDAKIELDRVKRDSQITLRKK